MSIQRYEDPSAPVQTQDVFQLGKVLFESGYFSDVKNAAQAIVKIMRGSELGLGPVASMENIYVVQGKTALSYPLIGAQIKRSGRYDYRVIAETDDSCEIAFFQEKEELGRSKFTMADARAAGLEKNPMWSKYKSTMLFARAMSQGARRYTPDVFGGAIYTPEELRDSQQSIESLPVMTAKVVDAKMEPQRDPAAKAKMEAAWTKLQDAGVGQGLDVPDIDWSKSDDELRGHYAIYADEIDARMNQREEGA
jgi:hypothetical protein